jgi:hypothetical protein
MHAHPVPLPPLHAPPPVRTCPPRSLPPPHSPPSPLLPPTPPLHPHISPLPHARQVLLSNGSIITASDDSNADLFWAIRGGGPFYAIILEWTFKLAKAPAVATVYEMDWNQADAAKAAQVLDAYNAWAPWLLPAKFAMVEAFYGYTTAKVIIYYHGPKADLLTALASPGAKALFSVPGGTELPAAELDWTDFILQVTNLQQEKGWGLGSLTVAAARAGDLKQRAPFTASSLLFAKAIPSTATAAMAKAVAARPNKGFYQVLALGAAAATALPAAASAWPHRDAIMKVQIYANGEDGYPWLSALRTTVAPATTGLYYYNYLDPELSFQQYFGPNAKRLATIKAQYDAGGYIQGWEGMPVYPVVRPGNDSSSTPPPASAVPSENDGSPPTNNDSNRLSPAPTPVTNTTNGSGTSPAAKPNAALAPAVPALSMLLCALAALLLML